MIIRILENREIVLDAIKSSQQINCPQMPTGPVSVLWYRDKYDGDDELVELLIDVAG